jgi:hypothetical protein
MASLRFIEPVLRRSNYFIFRDKNLKGVARLIDTENENRRRYLSKNPKLHEKINK